MGKKNTDDFVPDDGFVADEGFVPDAPAKRQKRYYPVSPDLPKSDMDWMTGGGKYQAEITDQPNQAAHTAQVAANVINGITFGKNIIPALGGYTNEMMAKDAAENKLTGGEELFSTLGATGAGLATGGVVRGGVGVAGRVIPAVGRFIKPLTTGGVAAQAVKTGGANVLASNLGNLASGAGEAVVNPADNMTVADVVSRAAQEAGPVSLFSGVGGALQGTGRALHSRSAPVRFLEDRGNKVGPFTSGKGPTFESSTGQAGLNPLTGDVTPESLRSARQQAAVDTDAALRGQERQSGVKYGQAEEAMLASGEDPYVKMTVPYQEMKARAGAATTERSTRGELKKHLEDWFTKLPETDVADPRAQVLFEKMGREPLQMPIEAKNLEYMFNDPARPANRALRVPLRDLEPETMVRRPFREGMEERESGNILMQAPRARDFIHSARAVQNPSAKVPQQDPVFGDIAELAREQLASTPLGEAAAKHGDVMRDVRNARQAFGFPQATETRAKPRGPMERAPVEAKVEELARQWVSEGEARLSPEAQAALASNPAVRDILESLGAVQAKSLMQFNAGMLHPQANTGGRFNLYGSMSMAGPATTRVIAPTLQGVGALRSGANASVDALSPYFERMITKKDDRTKR